MANGDVLKTSYKVQYKIGHKGSNYIDDIERDSYSEVRPRSISLAKTNEVIAVRVLAIHTTVFKEYEK